MEDREMITLKEGIRSGKLIPRRGILTGELNENSFAVSLHSVLNGTADKMYTDPTLFFGMTHFTRNIKGIYSDVLTRISKGGARPLQVIDDTFGGGKTHLIVGLRHLFLSANIAQSNSTIQSILKDVGLGNIPEVSLICIDCHDLSSMKDIRTIWGEIGRQLGCYNLVENYDKEMRKPDATTLTKVINSTGKPVLIMIDELVNYLRDSRGEKIGDTNLAEITVGFFHTMTDVIVNSKNAIFIITLPGTESAYKKESEILEEYKKIIKELSSREAAFTVPIEKADIYNVVNKVLWEFIDENLARQVAEELQRFYGYHSESFPEEVTHMSYYEKIIKSFPFSPALIDILYERVGTISEFQKARGVLRILTPVLRNIYNNISLLPKDMIITPGSVDLNENSVFQELTNKIGRGEFQNVIKTDIVNDDSEAKCQKLDSKSRFGPNVRIASVIYLYSLIGAVKETSIGCNPKELVLSTAVDKDIYPKDVLDYAKNLENNLWFINPIDKTGKWHFSVEVNINKVVQDETDVIQKIEYDKEIKERLGKMLGVTSHFEPYIWESDVRNPFMPTLVVVNYNEIKGAENQIPDIINKIIEKEGKDGFSFRSKKNLIYVLIPEVKRIEKIIEESKKYIAIKKIKKSMKSRTELKSYGSKINQLEKESDSNLNSSIELCYSQLYYPSGTDIKSVTIQNGYEGAENFPDKLYLALVKTGKLIDKLNPVYIVDKIMVSKSEMTINEIYQYFEESPNSPLPKDKQVLYDSITYGLDNKLFALYTGGIGDISSITSLNYEKIASNFYYNRRPISGTKDAHYIIKKNVAEDIENKLNSFVTGPKVGENIKEPFEKYTERGNETQELISISDLSKLYEYKGWHIRDIILNFSDTMMFPNIQSRLPTILLGISNIRYSIDILSYKMNVVIKDADISDLKGLLDALFKLSSMFPKEIIIKFKINIGDILKIDDDQVADISQLGKIVHTNLNLVK